MTHQIPTSAEEERFREIHRRVNQDLSNLAERFQQVCNFTMEVQNWIYEHHLEHPPKWGEWDMMLELYHDPISVYIELCGEWAVHRTSDDEYIELGKFSDVNLKEMDPNIWLGDFSSIEDGTDT